jgi:putative hydrolase of the HAD superfamily
MRNSLALIFDLGNVLLDFDHSIAAKKISRLCEKGSDEIFNLFFDSGITALFEEGRISPQDFFCRVRDMLKLKICYGEFLPIWNEIFFISDKNRAVQRLVCLLSRDYKLALLTNINILHFDYIKKTYPLFEPFSAVLTSFAVGFRKPKKEIYQRAIETLGVSAGDILYTDDRAELVEGARVLGIKGFVFRSPQQLEADLIQAGIRLGTR